MPKIFYRLLFYFLLTLIPINSWAVFPNCAEAKVGYNQWIIDIGVGTVNDAIIYECPGAEPTSIRAGYCFGMSAPQLSALPPEWSKSEKCARARFAATGRTKYGEYGDVYDGLKNAGASCNSVGNPINAGTGNKFQPETDYVGQGVFPLILTRSYNSVLSRYNTGWVFPSNWGRQWIGNYSQKVAYDPNSGTQPTAMLYRPNGQLLYFKQTTTGIFTPDADIHDKLIQLTANGVITGWKYTVASNQNTETYDASGKLLSISNRAGAT